MQTQHVFNRSQKFIIALLSFLQFTIILDFMILSPLGAMLMPALKVNPSQFGLVVSVYAFAAGVSGLLAAGFADRFDRKKLLLFFYSGFVLGTFLCGIAFNYPFLLAARMITGLFGGVMGSIVFAIITDLFALEVRGRVMGFIGTAFAGSQILGIPLGLYVSNLWGWHAPFLMIVAVSSVVGFFILRYMPNIHLHLKIHPDTSPLHHLKVTITTPAYLHAFAATALLATGGFMLMPFGSAFSVHNLGIPLEKLPPVYMITGFAAMFTGPLVGRAADIYGKFRIFALGSILSTVMVIYYTHLGITPIAVVILVSAIMFVGISARMVASQALISAIPEPLSRGSFMSVNSSLQQISGGFSAALAGLIVAEGADGKILHFDRLGYVVVGAIWITVVMMFTISKRVGETTATPPVHLKESA